MDVEELRRSVEEIRWYHTLDLGGGVKTPGLYDPTPKLPRYAIPEDLSGKSVLDIGAWDGFFSFEAERRGAARVLASDSYVWSGATWGSKDGFDLARRALDSSVEDEMIDVLELSPDAVGTFDVVLFLGVLYHMRHPLLALEKVASVTDDLLILETEVDLLHVRRPAFAFYPDRELRDDPTNWVGPNPAGVEAMLRDCGFREVRTLSSTNPAFMFAKWAAVRMRGGGYRMVFHARK